jgi:dTDP-4-amino-4,6-dideoxygalactose transaminase
LGATPVLADVDDTGHLTAEAVERAVTPRTRVVIPVHYAGEACDIDEIHEVARQHGLRVVEDAAHAIGADYKGAKIGANPLSDAVCFSFYATKNMTTGEGGMVTTHSQALANHIRTLSLHGMSHNAWSRYTKTGSWQYEVTEPGFKYNLSEIQAALGIHQLRRLDGFLQRRREIAAMFQRELSDIPGLTLPHEQADRRHIYHLYVVWIDSEQALVNRDEFIQGLKDANIGTSVHFIPLHRHPLYRDRFGYRPEQFPVAERLFSGIVSLPLYPAMSDADVADVVESVHSAVATGRLTAASTAERY